MPKCLKQYYTSFENLDLPTCNRKCYRDIYKHLSCLYGHICWEKQVHIEMVENNTFATNWMRAVYCYLQ